ncbi:hypothetical protein DAEQUDRAFT_758924 [Daedalea quercina L-15889]|uniref:MYND-type domain-containing protein n=1 Tax=Daedalea quercina L-15889 TaxID=1314783 RepID=A0A165MU14_9APHY|nr:hypothetical protein DAEQUDRAFT_758924 [Daedalea quercina L-15889]
MITSSVQVPPAPNAARRHVYSNPDETISRRARQCQYCTQREEDGVAMRKCGGCKVDRYCSKKCQKAAWPVHKKICKLNQETNSILELHSGDLERLEALRDFTRKHRSTISEAAFHSVRHNYLPPLSADPAATSEVREDVLVIELRTRPNAQQARPEKRFYVMGAQLETFASFFPDEKLEEMRLRLRSTRVEATRHRGLSSAVIVVLCLVDPDMDLMNVMPIAFLLDQSDVDELELP